MQIELTSRLIKYALSIAVPLSVVVYVFTSPGKSDPSGVTDDQAAGIPRSHVAPDSPPAGLENETVPEAKPGPILRPLPTSPSQKRPPHPRNGRRIPKPKTQVPAG